MDDVPSPEDPPRPRPFESFHVGERAAEDIVVGEDHVERFADLTGDRNPLHMDVDFARQVGSGGRVVHGMLVAGFVSRVIGTQLPGPGALWFAQSFMFRAPVRIGDQLHVEVVVRRLSPGIRVLVLGVVVTNQRRVVVMDGEAQVQVLDRIGKVASPAKEAAVAVVTGSGRGIGAAIARSLASDGLKVVVNYRSDQGAAERTAEGIREAGGEVATKRADVSDPSAAADLIAYARSRYGEVDVLVNNAGGPINPRLLRDTTWNEVSAHIRCHLGGAFFCTEAALPAMVEQKFGRIVNIVSQASSGLPPPKMGGYVIAKSALAAYTRCLAAELGSSGITANAVSPGMTETDLVGDIPQRAKLALAAQAPLRRLGRPDDVAAVVSFLTGPGGGYITGQTIHVSGGQVMQ
jgi:3-oxoacyl-[acyl-carrier protein] reductase